MKSVKDGLELAVKEDPSEYTGREIITPYELEPIEFDNVPLTPPEIKELDGNVDDLLEKQFTEEEETEEKETEHGTDH